MGKDKTQTTTQRLDPASERYVGSLRAAGREAVDYLDNFEGPIFLGPDERSITDQIQPFLDPYIQRVIGGLGDHYNRLRRGARRNVSQETTAAGVNPATSSRAGIAEGVRLGEIDRAEGAQVAGLLSSGFRNALTTGLQHSEYQRALRERLLQEGIHRRQLRQGFLTGSLGPTGMTSESIQPGNFWGDALGVGLTGLAFLAGGPGGAAGVQGLLSRGGGGGGMTVPPVPGILRPDYNIFQGQLPGRF